jgi:transposase InsO family protein
MSSTSSTLSPAPLPLQSFITVGNGARLPVTHVAAATIPTSSSPLRLNNVLVTPSLIKNLVSVKQLTRDNNVSVEFDSLGFSVKDLASQTVILRCEGSDDLYPMRLPQHEAHTTSSTSVELWHDRLGHPGAASLRQVLQSFDFQCNKSAAHSCHRCQLGKHVRLPFSSSDTPAYFPFQLVHSDVWTSPVYSISSYKYYVVFIDAFTHYIWTFPLQNKSKVPAIIRSFFSYVHTQFRLLVVALQTDNGQEFDTHAMRLFLAATGTAFRLTYPYSSQQNGKAERILKTINDWFAHS